MEFEDLIEKGEAFGWTRLAVLFVVVIVAVWVVKKLMKSDTVGEQFKVFTCTCGWRGAASKHRPVCPSCRAKLSD